MSEPRRRFDREFKIEAVKLASRADKINLSSRARLENQRKYPLQMEATNGR